MDNYCIRKVIPDLDLEKIKDVLNFANKENRWKDGKLSAGGNTVKSNIELDDIQLLSTINSIVMFHLDNDIDFFEFAIPSKSNHIFVSKMEVGGKYGLHHDMEYLGDFSTTLFLNDPKEYEGGELCLFIDGKEEKIKLEAGYAITYKTGIPHKVNPVSSGCRYVCVFWTHTHIKDEFMREIFGGLSKVERLVAKYTEDQKFNYDSFDPVTEDPNFILKRLKVEIIRRHIR